MTDGKEAMEKQLIDIMPDDVKQVFIALAETTLIRWEAMSQEDRDRYDDSIEAYLGTQVLETTLRILKYSEEE